MTDRLITYDEACALMQDQPVARVAETVRLDRAGRRILAEPVLAGIDSPRRDVSAMDGYAVRRTDVVTGSRPLDIIGESYPGQPFDGAIAEGQTVRIFTGAALPGGADQIMLQETAVREGCRVRFDPGSLPARDHIRRRGSDFRRGDALLEPGVLVDTRALMIASAADVTEIRAWRRPTVRAIAMGDELVPPGEAGRTASLVPDSLSGAVLMSVRQWGGTPLGGVLVRDGPAAIADAANEALIAADVVVLIGGASTGDRDFARSALAGLGLDFAFTKVAIKPGKPVWYGRIGERHVLGLPGNPGAALITARLFLAPLLSRLSGRAFCAPLAWSEATLLGPLEENSSREAFVGAEWTAEGIVPIPGLAASSQRAMAHANAIIRRAAGAAALAPGVRIEFLRF